MRGRARTVGFEQEGCCWRRERRSGFGSKHASTAAEAPDLEMPACDIRQVRPAAASPTFLLRSTRPRLTARALTRELAGIARKETFCMTLALRRTIAAIAIVAFAVAAAPSA